MVGNDNREKLNFLQIPERQKGVGGLKSCANHSWKSNMLCVCSCMCPSSSGSATSGKSIHTYTLWGELIKSNSLGSE